MSTASWPSASPASTISPFARPIGSITGPLGGGLTITSNAEIERKVLEQVGSYGKQIGHLAEALEVVIQALPLLDGRQLTREQRDALQVFLGDVAAVRRIKDASKSA